jgi:hypothetical protein
LTKKQLLLKKKMNEDLKAIAFNNEEEEEEEVEEVLIVAMDEKLPVQPVIEEVISVDRTRLDLENEIEDEFRRAHLIP